MDGRRSLPVLTCGENTMRLRLPPVMEDSLTGAAPAAPDSALSVLKQAP